MAIYQLAETSTSRYYPATDDPKFAYREDFDPSLLRLNTVDKLVTYCDSLYSEKIYKGEQVKFQETFPAIVSAVIRDRFYHGYSSYRIKNNFLAALVSRFSMKGLSAIVIPDDILKYPYAACSQQSIVMMEILERKGFTTRKVGFQGKLNGHFCFEAYYDGGWHFYDPDMEPDVTVLNAYNHPSIALLARHPDILVKAYHQYPAEQVLDIFPQLFLWTG